ncbi:MAG: hypothetical protein ACI9MU_004399, partial [Alphaproteobacteria bacterium]
MPIMVVTYRTINFHYHIVDALIERPKPLKNRFERHISHFLGRFHYLCADLSNLIVYRR